ncbi:MAG: hypothetical protein K8S94_07690 [Planctomycetia bacterium]|nr:hypothetical protein [Planctomycetia bacterium]
MSMITFRRTITAGAAALAVWLAMDSVRADLTVAGVFGDRMVVQRDRPVHVWGTAVAGETVTVEFAGQTKSAATDAAGTWQLTLDPLPANAAGQTLTVRIGDAKPGSNRRVFTDVLVGDVWLLAGGADVGRAVMHLSNPDAAAAEFTPAGFTLARTCVLPPKTATDPVDDIKGTWAAVGSGDPKRIPVEAMQLAKAIGDAVGESGGMKIPVGVIVASNPRPVECWMSPETLAATPAAKPILDFYASDAWKTFSTGSFEDRMKAWLEYNQKLPLNPLPKPKPTDDVSRPQQDPSCVWNGMIAPLVQPAGLKDCFLAVRGIVWHHGEDWATQSRAIQQGQLLAALIPGWRTAFHQADMPFVIVQLPPHRYAGGIGGIGIDGRLAAELRDGQVDAAKAAKATLVTTIDLPADPSPAVLGNRIADVVAAHVSGKGPGEVTGPTLASAETTGDKVVLSFTNTKGSLTAKGGKLEGFAIAVSPMRWVWADATIDGDTVTVSSPVVSKPQGVRYAYEDVPSRGATLCDAQGNPASPFRTDTHPSVTAANVDPTAPILRFSRRTNPTIEDGSLPRVLIIGDSISGHYLERVRLLMEGKANIVGEASMDPKKNSWAAVGAHFYRTDTATKGDDLKTFLAESGPWDIVHFNIGIHMFAGAKPGDEKAYADKLRQVVQTIRDSGAVCLFANSTGTVADNTMPRFPNYLTNCKAFNAAAEEVMREMGVPVTDIYGMIQPRIKELISGDLIHTSAEADQMMAELIAKRLTETIATLPKRLH